MIDEIKQSANVILFIDDVHKFLGAKASVDFRAAYCLRSILEDENLQCIVCTTLDEYKINRKFSFLKRNFQPVLVPEPTIDVTIEILKGKKELHETDHKVCYTDEAFVAAAELSYKHIRYGFLPSKAINLLDAAGSDVHHRNAQLLRLDIGETKEVRDEDICEVLSLYGLL